MRRTKPTAGWPACAAAAGPVHGAADRRSTSRHSTPAFDNRAERPPPFDRSRPDDRRVAPAAPPPASAAPGSLALVEGSWARCRPVRRAGPDPPTDRGPRSRRSRRREDPRGPRGRRSRRQRDSPSGRSRGPSGSCRRADLPMPRRAAGVLAGGTFQAVARRRRRWRVPAGRAERPPPPGPRDGDSPSGVFPGRRATPARAATMQHPRRLPSRVAADAVPAPTTSRPARRARRRIALRSRTITARTWSRSSNRWRTTRRQGPRPSRRRSCRSSRRWPEQQPGQRALPASRARRAAEEPVPRRRGARRGDGRTSATPRHGGRPDPDVPDADRRRPAIRPRVPWRARLRREPPAAADAIRTRSRPAPASASGRRPAPRRPAPTTRPRAGQTPPDVADERLRPGRPWHGAGTATTPAGRNRLRFRRPASRIGLRSRRRNGLRRPGSGGPDRFRRGRAAAYRRTRSDRTALRRGEIAGVRVDDRPACAGRGGWLAETTVPGRGGMTPGRFRGRARRLSTGVPARRAATGTARRRGFDTGIRRRRRGPPAAASRGGTAPAPPHGDVRHRRSVDPSTTAAAAARRVAVATRGVPGDYTTGGTRRALREPPAVPPARLNDPTVLT